MATAAAEVPVPDPALYPSVPSDDAGLATLMSLVETAKEGKVEDD